MAQKFIYLFFILWAVKYEILFYIQAKEALESTNISIVFLKKENEITYIGLKKSINMINIQKIKLCRSLDIGSKF